MNSHEPGRLLQKGIGQQLKRVSQSFIRAVHHSFFDRGLPDQLAIYLHELDPATVGLLEDSITDLKNLGYRFVDAETFDSGDGTADRIAMVSFDDNYRSWHENLDLFDRYEIKAVFYVNTLPLGRDASAGEVIDYYDRLGSLVDRQPLTEAELIEIVSRGHTIGGHSHSHYNLGTLPAEDALADIAVNLEALEKFTGSPVVDFSFPFGMPGNFPPALDGKVRAMGIKRIAHATPGMQHSRKCQGTIHRALWRISRGVEGNLHDARVDGSRFVQLTGKSPIG